MWVIPVLYLSERQHRTIYTLQLSCDLEFKQQVLYLKRMTGSTALVPLIQNYDTYILHVRTLLSLCGPLRCLIQVGLAWPVSSFHDCRKNKLSLSPAPDFSYLITPGASPFSSHILNSLPHPLRCLLFLFFLCLLLAAVRVRHIGITFFSSFFNNLNHAVFRTLGFEPRRGCCCGLCR